MYHHLASDPALQREDSHCKAEFITENAIVVSGEAFVDRGAYR